MIVKRILLLFSLSLSALFADLPMEMTVKAANNVIFALRGESQHTILQDLLVIARHGHSLPDYIKQELVELRFDFTKSSVVRSRPNLDHHFDAGIFRIHYNTSSDTAVSPLDTAGIIGIPDYVETVANAFNYTAQIELTELGFYRPPNDNNGGSNHYDIYITSLSNNVYAFTNPESETGDNNNSPFNEINAWTSYIEIRNEYAGFPNTEEENIQVTAAHEFFHGIQFGYDGWEQVWLLEATAVLMEEIVFDDVNDCYQYMPGWFDKPYLSLDLLGNRMYGSFIFFQYIFEHLGGYETIRRIFEYSISYDSYQHDYSHQVISLALEPVNSSFPDALNKMVAANLIMSNDAGIYSYEEADSYRVQVLLPIEETINYLAGDTLSVYNYKLNRFASQYFEVNTFSPILVTLTNQSGPASDLNLLAILEISNGIYEVLSGNMLNIPNDYLSINLAVVSQDTLGNNWNFKLFFQLGATGNFLIPDDFEIALAYPNPFDPALDLMTIEIISRFTQSMDVNIVNMAGRNIISLKNDPIEFGKTRLIWNGRTSANSPAASGTYIIVATGDQNTKSKLITILK